MEKNRYFNSDFIELNGRKYCPYCGSLLKEYTEIGHGYDFTEYYNCECADAEKAAKIQEQIRSLECSLPKKNYYVGQAILKRN